MVVPPFHTPKWSFLVGKPHGCWGNPPFQESPIWSICMVNVGTYTIQKAIYIECLGLHIIQCPPFRSFLTGISSLPFHHFIPKDTIFLPVQFVTEDFYEMWLCSESRTKIVKKARCSWSLLRVVSKKKIFLHIRTPTWENDPIWRSYFSTGLKPTTN